MNAFLPYLSARAEVGHEKAKRRNNWVKTGVVLDDERNCRYRLFECSAGRLEALVWNRSTLR